MFVAEKLIYLQMQKTACTHIAGILGELIEGSQNGKHNRLENPDPGKFIVGSIRNPWEWYVSLWAFGCNRTGGIYNRTVKRKLNTGKKYIQSKWGGRKKLKGKYLDLNNVDIFRFYINELTKPAAKWQEYYSDSSSKRNFKSWLFNLHDPRRKWDHGGEFAMSSVSQFAGLMTYRYAYFFMNNFFTGSGFRGIKNINDLNQFDIENNILDFVIRTENLESDLIKAVTLAGYHLDKKDQDLVYHNANNRRNTSEHEEFSFYHDKDTVELIAERDKFIIEKYHYDPPRFS